MSRLGWIVVGGVAVAASTHCGYPDFAFSGYGGSGASDGGTSSSSGGGLTCSQVHGTFGCCDGAGNLHYCNNGKLVQNMVCTAAAPCGWDGINGFYNCGGFPGGPDPSNMNPIACGP